MATENRLGKELSPYLLQHRHNPVDWYPWGTEAIEKARAENKMIFLSIGYSTCHWCHVMERESFESEEVAAVMNKDFINVKVDREERPDVDKVYMTFVQATTGGGGWPLSLWLSPTLNPVFGGTYFPPEGNFGRPGFKQVLSALASQWEESDNRTDMVEAGEQVIKIIDKKMGSGSLSASSSLPGPQVFRKLYTQLAHSYDSEFGGYSGPPKFPQASNLMVMFRLQSWADESSDRLKKGLEMNLHTLDMMDLGGIHDHIMSGFARYSTDKEWHVPHFEKMLYDQAQLAIAYATAFTITNDIKYKKVVEDIMTFVNRDMTHQSGGFFAAEDADSLPKGETKGKKEGAFCVWSWDEIQHLLSKPVEGVASEVTLADVVAHEFNMKEGGNVNPRADPHGELKGQNVLTKLPVKPALIADTEKYNSALTEAKKILFTERLTRPRPGLDSKILCSWNSLMLSAFCKAGTALDMPEYVATAVRVGEFVKDVLWSREKKRLLRSIYGGQEELAQLDHPIEGFVDDYCYTVQAFIDLYTATLNEDWLSLAVEVQTAQDLLFLDKDNGGYFASKAGDPEIVLRLKDDQDGAEPSSNSVSAMNLLRLGKILNSEQYQLEGEKILKLFHDRLQQLPHAMPALVDAFLFLHQSEPTILITGDVSSANPVLAHIRSSHLPSHTIIAGGDLVRAAHPTLTSVKWDQTGAYLIRNGQLSDIITSVDQFKEIIAK
eukprot:GFUD01016620.1.p1 GENE.GFUD01016620.1~~GFUD01016620.1.p1  ORF type:complete len:719 (+),score=222.67 GFUD01016620.1:106-2262(+)